MSIKYYALASNEELPEEFCAIRHEHGEPCDYHFYVPERTCRMEWSLADNGWADHTCSNCGYVENTDIHVSLGWKFCPNCGARIEVGE